MINPMMNTLHERLLTLADGRQVALLDNQPTDQELPGKPLLIALHGWLDNSASFLPLAPHLGDFHLICVDLPTGWTISTRSCRRRAGRVSLCSVTPSGR